MEQNSRRHDRQAKGAAVQGPTRQLRRGAWRSCESHATATPAHSPLSVPISATKCPNLRCPYPLPISPTKCPNLHCPFFFRGQQRLLLPSARGKLRGPVSRGDPPKRPRVGPHLPQPTRGHKNAREGRCTSDYLRHTPPRRDARKSANHTTSAETNRHASTPDKRE